MRHTLVLEKKQYLYINMYILVTKAKTQTGGTVNLSWTAAFFPKSGAYNVYHTYTENRTIFSISSNGVRYGGDTKSAKYTYITRPFDSTNIMFEISNITLGDSGYYNSGISSEAAWSGGGAVLIVKGKLFLCFTLLHFFEEEN